MLNKLWEKKVPKDVLDVRKETSTVCFIIKDHSNCLLRVTNDTKYQAMRLKIKNKLSKIKNKLDLIQHKS